MEERLLLLWERYDYNICALFRLRNDVLLESWLPNVLLNIILLSQELMCAAGWLVSRFLGFLFHPPNMFTYFKTA